MTLRNITILVLATVLSVACGTPPTPRQLTDARAAYRKAQSGHASRLAPAELHTAKVALNEAEAAFKQEPESEGTVTLAYVALRLAQQVESEANAKAAKKDLGVAHKEYQELQGKEMQRTREELASAKQQLNARDRELAVRGEQLAAADSQLAMTADQLAAEKAARAAAEAREREAMRKLAAAAAINVKEEPRGTVIILPGNVMFDSGKYELTPGAQKKMILVAGTLAPQSESNNITVEGHTDSRGKRDSNMSLSQQRADAVANFLIRNGVLKESVKSFGKGPDVPLASNDTREGRQQNRRVEIIIKPMEAR